MTLPSQFSGAMYYRLECRLCQWHGFVNIDSIGSQPGVIAELIKGVTTSHRCRTQRENIIN